jgi:hypothetical protein
VAVQGRLGRFAANEANLTEFLKAKAARSLRLIRGIQLRKK